MEHLIDLAKRYGEGLTGGEYLRMTAIELHKQYEARLASGDPDQPVLVEMTLRDETICIYPHAWVAIIQKDRSFEVCRMD